MAELYNKLKVVKSKEAMLKGFEDFFEEKRITDKLCRSEVGEKWYNNFIKLNVQFMEKTEDGDKFSVSKYKLLLETLEKQFEERTRGL